MPDDASVLELHGWGLARGDKVVVAAIDMAVPPLGCTALLGGKAQDRSTVLRALAGLTMASLHCWGQARYQGQPCGSLNRPLLVLPSVQQLGASVQDGLIAAMAQRGQMTRAEQVELVTHTLRHHGLDDLVGQLRTRLIDLSLPEQRILMVLRGVLARPALLCLDDPLDGLDGSATQALIDLIRQVGRERAVLLALESLAQAEQLQARVVSLDREKAAGRRLPQAAVAPSVQSGPESWVNLAEAKAGVWARSVLRPSGVGPTGFHWLLPGQLAGTPWPGVVHDVRYDLDVLHTAGITCLVSLTETPFDPLLAGEFGIRCLASPIPDMAAPTLDQAIGLCRAIDQALAAGEAVAVHCYAGLGRTGTVLVSYALWRAQGQLTGAHALAQARRIHAGWVQSLEQIDFLDAFARHLASGCVDFSPAAQG